MNHWSIALLVAACSVAAADAPPGTAIPGDPAHVHMPKVRGMIRKDAEATIRAAGISGEIRVEALTPEGEATWKVCNQTPSEGQVVPLKWDVTIGFCHDRPTAEDRRPKLEGMPVEDAKKKMRELGYKGKIEVQNITSDVPKDCKPQTVCYMDPLRWYLDMDEENFTTRIMAIMPVKIKLPD